MRLYNFHSNGLFIDLARKYKLEVRTLGCKARFVLGEYHIPPILPIIYNSLYNRLKYKDTL